MPTYTRDIRQLLQTAYSSKASDLHISVGSPPVIRMDGKLHSLEGESVVAEEAADMVKRYLVMNELKHFGMRASWIFHIRLMVG